ncbi:MAG TPA: dihydrofolate reductase [Candidatus Paceibacterota bacterium]|nr:dihydrofolate reductase [Candidatus Paceibacterota bacterium]
MQDISLVVALGHNNVIGKDNGLLWHLPDDLKRFKMLTLGHPVIMGRKTWESLPERVRPLPGRTNIVVTRDENYRADGALVARSIEDAFELAKASPGSEEICVIGGGEIYRLALPHATRLYLTLVDDPTPGTVTFPDYAEFTKEVEREEHSESGINYTWLRLDRELP